MEKIKSILLNTLMISLVVLIIGAVMFGLAGGSLLLSGIQFASRGALFWFIVKIYLIGIPCEVLESVFKVLFELTNIFSPKVLYWFNQIIGFVITTMNIHLADVFSPDVTLPLWGKFFGSFLIILMGIILDRESKKDEDQTDSLVAE